MAKSIGKQAKEISIEPVQNVDDVKGELTTEETCESCDYTISSNSFFDSCDIKKELIEVTEQQLSEDIEGETRLSTTVVKDEKSEDLDTPLNVVEHLPVKTEQQSKNGHDTKMTSEKREIAKKQFSGCSIGKKILYKLPCTKRTSKHRQQCRDVNVGEEKSNDSCDVCGKSFSSFSSLVDHALLHHSGGPKPCGSTSGKPSSDHPNGIKEDRRVEKPYRCDKCGKSFHRSNILEQHTSIHTGKKPYICSVCDKSFGWSVSLKGHMMIHTGEKPHQCTVCDKSFRYFTPLKRHMFIHTGEKLSACTVCNKSFLHSTGLKQHMLGHTRKTPFNCTVCDQFFTRASSLKKHMGLHSGERIYNCTVCDKSFGQVSRLKQHLLAHSGEKPYSCTMCDKSFTQLNALKQHLLLHTGEKLLRCTLCDKSFTYASNLKKHMVVHTDKRAHHCIICDENFTQASSLNKHMLCHGENQ